MYLLAPPPVHLGLGRASEKKYARVDRHDDRVGHVNDWRVAANMSSVFLYIGGSPALRVRTNMAPPLGVWQAWATGSAGSRLG